MSPFKEPEKRRAYHRQYQRERYYPKHRDERIVYSRRHYQEHKQEKRTKARRAYYENRPERLAHQRRYKQKNKDTIREYNQKYYQKHREDLLEYHRAYYAINKEKRDAKNWARNIPIATICQKCGAIENLEKHHPDYEEPLKIVTLCHRCHMSLHRGLIQEEPPVALTRK